MDRSDQFEVSTPPPIPGMRPPLGSPGGPVPAPKSSMGFVMPIYTICIIVFFVYTLTKILFRRQGNPYDPVVPDPQFRRRVFRDDSRSSPEKLGKKEADAIVTAISGLVAEVQQQMEASGAPNQQRQDVQDNARPYTNGTILLNSGPVQIVTSEYKEAFKEKTPELVTEKDSTSELNKAEPTKVVKESSTEVEVPVSIPKESFPEVVEPPNELELILEDIKATTETVVFRQSSPERLDIEECKEPVLELKESTPEPKVDLEFTPESLLNLAEDVLISGLTEESISAIVPTSEVKESDPEPIPEPEVILDFNPDSKSNNIGNLSASEVSKDTSIISDSKESSPKPIELSFEPVELLTKPVELSFKSEESLLETNESVFEPNHPISEYPVQPKETLSETEETITEPLLEPKKTTLELINPTLESIKSNSESEETALETIIQTTHKPPVELSELEESSVLMAKKLEDSDIEPKETSIESEQIKSTPEPEDSVIECKESSLEPKFSASELKSLEASLDTVEPISIPEISSFDLKEPALESHEPILINEPLIKSSLDPEESCSSSHVSDPHAHIPNIKESTHTPIDIIPEQKENTVNINQSIPEHHETAIYKKSTLELVEKSQDIKAPIVERSPESKFIEHLSELEAPILECSPEPELVQKSQEVDAPGIEYSSHSNTKLLKLNEPTLQSKETTPERKVTEELGSIQVEDKSAALEGSLLDLEEAIADLDVTTVKQQEKESEEVKTQLKELHQGDYKPEELLMILDHTTVNTEADNLAKTNDDFLSGERFVLVNQSSPDVTEDNKNLRPKSTDDYKLYTEVDEEDIENAAVKVMGMEMTAHPEDCSEWPRDERPPPPASSASPPPRAPHAAEEVKSIFLETEIPQQSRVLVTQFQEDRPPRPAAHAPLVVSGKMTLSLIQDAPRETPERDPESTLDEFTTASAVTQPAAEKGEIESDEEIDEEIEVEEIELEEEEEELEELEEPPVTKTPVKK